MAVLAALLVMAPAVGGTQVVAASSPCADTVTSGYTVHTCLTAPGDGATVSGVTTVRATTQVTAGTTKVREVVFSLAAEYVLTDFSAQSVAGGVSTWQFSLPTAMWVDGSRLLSALPLIGNSKAKGTAASVNVTFLNGVTVPPTNSNNFTPALGTAPPPGQQFVVAAVGDGAAGTHGSDGVVSLLQGWNPNLFLYLGDVYERGTYTEFYNWYSPGWGSLYSVTDPTIGNHEAETPGGAGYEWYWNNVPLYYSFNTQGWHFIVLDGNPANKFPGYNAQLTWLQNDLAQHAGECIVATWHQPLYDEGPAGGSSQVQGLWNQLVAAHATLVLNGHDHTYQRWEPLDATGASDPTGLTEIIVGTGDHDLQKIHTPFDPRVVAAAFGSKASGAFRMTVSATSLAFTFTETSGTVADSGTIPCRAQP